MMDRRNRLRIFSARIVVAVLLAAGLCGAVASARSGSDDAEARLRKAEMLYLEAADAFDAQRIDDYYMLLRRAAALAPDDPYIAGSLAEVEISMPTSDSLMRENAYDMIARRFRANPSDEHYATIFAAVASQAGRIDDVISVWETLDSILPSRTDPAMRLAQALMMRYAKTTDTVDFNRAQAIYRRLEGGLGPRMEISLPKIQAFLMRRDTSAIAAELRALHRSAPADVRTNLFIGDVYNHIERPDSALAFYNRACEIDSTEGMVYLARASFFQSQGDSVAYDREVFRALEAPALDFNAKLELLQDYVVKLYTDSAQRPRIEQMFDTLQVVNPGEAAFHSFYGRYKATVGSLPEAAEQFSYSLDLEPADNDAWQSLVQLYNMMDDYPHMADAARRGLRFFPDDGYLALMGSSALIQMEQRPQALALLDSIDPADLPTDKMRSALYGTRGDILYSLNEPDSAFVNYEKAIEYDSDNFMALNNCAYHMAVTGRDLDRAELYASIANAAEPENPTYVDTYAWVLFRKGDYEKARQVIEGAVKVCDENPDEASAEIYDHAGDIYYFLGDHAEALRLWKAALRLDSDNKLIKKKVARKAYFETL